MRSRIEKPLLEVGDKPMIHQVIDALKSSGSINRIIVAVSPDTRYTAVIAREIGAEVAETDGAGYEQDMKQAIKSHKLGDVVVVAADLPFLVPAIVDEAVQKYLASGKPALMVAAPVELYEKFGLKGSYAFNWEGQEVAPVGLNVIDGKRIDEGRLEEAVLVVRDDNLVFNVNTQTDLELAKDHYGDRS